MEDKPGGSDATGSESTLKEMGTPPRNPWLERKPRPASAGQVAPEEGELGEAERRDGSNAYPAGD